jgi:hypothetical protein
MQKKKAEAVHEVKDESQEGELVSSDDIDIEVRLDPDTNTVMVLFSNFEDYEDAEEYAEMLAETLPLLLFESTRMQ